MDLKKLYDAVNAATARVREIAAKIDGLLAGGQNDEALALKPELDQARADEQHASEVYQTALAAAQAQQGRDPARRFVPAQGEAQGQGAQERMLGMAPREVARYSLSRAILAAADARTNPSAWDAAGLEREASRAMATMLGREPQGFFVPTDVQAAWALRNAGQTVGDPSTGGYLKTTELMTQAFIDVLRAKMVLRAAGATVLSGLVGDIEIPKKTSGATAYWIGEGNAPSMSTLGFGQVGGRLRTIAAYAQLSRKLLRQASMDAEALVRDDIAQTLALGFDLAGLHGTGAGNQPLGLQYQTGIGSVVGGNDGAAPDWADIVDLETEIATDNADVGSLAYVTNPKVRGKLKQTTKANNQNGFVWEGDTMNGYRALVTTQVASTLVKGQSGAVCSAIFFGNWADMVLLFWGGLDVLVDPYTNSTSGSILITSMMDGDILFRRAQSFAAMLDAKAG